MQLFRIQDKKGRGPFKPNFTEKWLEIEKDYARFQPWFAEFPNLKPQQGMGCACESIEQLKGWFTEVEYNRLKKLGYKAVKITVDKVVAKGLEQSVFYKSDRFNKRVKAFRLY